MEWVPGIPGSGSKRVFTSVWEAVLDVRWLICVESGLKDPKLSVQMEWKPLTFMAFTVEEEALRN